MSQIDGLSESSKYYMGAILELQNAHKVARSKDIAEKLEIKRGSVTNMLKNLAKKGMINYEPYGFVTLSCEGEAIALEIKRRQTIIKEFLIGVLRVEDKKAEIAARHIEHGMDGLSVDRLLQFISFIDRCPRTGPEWIRSFVEFCAARRPGQQRCRSCMEGCLRKISPE
ncbi:MAG: metal-dependent transcriptional regulator [Pseudomonadota bacterium]